MDPDQIWFQRCSANCSSILRVPSATWYSKWKGREAWNSRMDCLISSNWNFLYQGLSFFSPPWQTGGWSHELFLHQVSPKSGSSAQSRKGFHQREGERNTERERDKLESPEMDFNGKSAFKPMPLQWNNPLPFTDNHHSGGCSWFRWRDVVVPLTSLSLPLPSENCP